MDVVESGDCPHNVGEKYANNCQNLIEGTEQASLLGTSNFCYVQLKEMMKVRIQS